MQRSPRYRPMGRASHRASISSTLTRLRQWPDEERKPSSSGGGQAANKVTSSSDGPTPA